MREDTEEGREGNEISRLRSECRVGEGDGRFANRPYGEMKVVEGHS